MGEILLTNWEHNINTIRKVRGENEEAFFFFQTKKQCKHKVEEQMKLKEKS